MKSMGHLLLSSSMLMFAAGSVLGGAPVRNGLISLKDSLLPLQERFNAGKSKPSVLAVLSPTCGGCVYAARAVAGSIVKDHPKADINIHIVWVPMLGGDSEAAAIEESALFHDPRIIQYWDPNRRAGGALSKHLFPKWAADGASVLAKDHWAHESLTARAALPPEERPLWDMALFFKKGATWGDTPPKPADWVKQIGFYGKQADGNSGAFWKNTFAQVPFDSDWFDELTRGMKATLASAARSPGSTRSAEKKGVTKFPDTIGGTVAKAFIDAFNSGDDEAIRAFNQQHRSASALEKRSMKERVDQYHTLLKDWGRLEVLNIVSTGERKITVTTRALAADTKLDFEFEFETDGPKKLNVIYIRSDRRPISAAPVKREGIGAARRLA